MTTKRSVLGVVSASVLALLLVAGCGGGGSDPAPTDKVAPTVLADQVTPAVGATVEKRALSVKVPFSEPIACFSGEQPFADNGFTGKATCHGAEVTMNFDDASLAGKTNVTATLSKLTDLAGNPMVPFSWTYQLRGEVAVTYPASVVVFGPNWVYRVDPTVPGGVVPIANRSGHDFYSYGFRTTVLPNCQIQVSALDNYTFTPLQFFWDRKKEEFTLDTSGTAPPRLIDNYLFSVAPDPVFPETIINVQVEDERYYVLNAEATLRYRKGTAPELILGTFPLGIKAVISYPACTTP